MRQRNFSNPSSHKRNNNKKIKSYVRCIINVIIFDSTYFLCIYQFCIIQLVVIQEFRYIKNHFNSLHWSLLVKHSLIKTTLGFYVSQTYTCVTIFGTRVMLHVWENMCSTGVACIFLNYVKEIFFYNLTS